MAQGNAAAFESSIPAGLTQTERVFDTFVSPSRTFADILRSASWWLPFLLAVLVSLAVTVTIDRTVGFERVVENQVHSSPRQEEQMSAMAPDARAVQQHRMAIGYRYSSYASPVIILAFSALGALLLWGTVNFGFGAQTTYAQILAVWMYASLPRLLTGVLTCISLLLGGNTEGFDLKNPVGTNLAYYLPDLSPTLRAGLSFIDIIGLWTLVLLVLGIAIVARVSRGKALAVVGGLWLIGLLLSLATTAAFS